MAGMKKSSVIGAGLGGLAAAIRLAVLELDVHVYETNSVQRGKAGYIEDERLRLFFYQRKML